MSEENIERLNVVELYIKKDLDDRNGIDVMYILDMLLKRTEGLEKKLNIVANTLDSFLEQLKGSSKGYNDSEEDEE